ncbi:TIR domain-containing protein [Agrobacterium vitis]|uniref:TIR domain-containing protein n=1 Tax=Agrobacterium vitis TaxID=373 RepID=UPI0015DAB4F4|nr:TIR domain-containing protein [Agrobacterium vitis]MCF1454044.1 hypothetical protein [Agrobacterium vitis]BCH52791.1 hypothetical protein RvVAR031_04010 [Agrobacterium vitis]
MTASKELFTLAIELNQLSKGADAQEIEGPINALTEASSEVVKAFSGSWLGYHSRVYYEGLKAPPPGAHFSQEWGLKGESWIGLGSTGDWCEYTDDTVKNYIFHKAGVTGVEELEQLTRPKRDQFSLLKADVVSILTSENPSSTDGFLTKLLEEANKIEPMSSHQIIEALRPRGQVITRDTTALGQGSRVPPHMDVLAAVLSVSQIFNACKELEAVARKAGSHLERAEKKRAYTVRVGTNVFIGHGRSGAWRELKDFLQDRFRLPWDEFNRVPVAGITNITRLSEMLDAAAIAFLVMTAEDELADGALQARMNVIHEAGLFQGKLGFTRAIVLLEDGCSEFSNIAGLGQIRFPKGKIDAVFEQVRQVLEREGLLGSD